MSDNITAEIIAIGTEILLGEITDTNSVYIARTLRDIGINVYYMISVGDNKERIAHTIRHALQRSDVVITCGGLGPTVDDMTRQSVADATNRSLVFHQELLEQIAARFAGFKVKMTENNRRQAFLPENAGVIENPVGTAPSFFVEHEGSVVISLPGVPREMKFLMTQRVVPYLQEKYELGIIKARVLQTAGIGESSLDSLIGNELLEQSNPTVGLAAHQGCVDVRVTVKAEDGITANRLLDEAETALRERIGRFIFGSDGEKLEDVLVNTLQEQNFKLAILEAGIENAVIKRLEDTGQTVSTASQAYAHPDDVYSQFGVDADAELREAAVKVAAEIAQQNSAEAGIAILSLPDVGENEDKNVASAVAVYVRGETHARVYGFGAQSDLARVWMTNWAMANTWRLIREQLDEA